MQNIEGGRMITQILLAVGGAGVLVGFFGIRTLRPTERGLIETFGKYSRYAKPGFNWVIPLVEDIKVVNITERMVNAEPQTIITRDKLNAQVDAQVYYKVKDDEETVKASQYNVYDYKNQIVNLARTTLRNIIGTLTLTEANSDRDKINTALMDTLKKETTNWGIAVVRTELKEIDPPQDVQATMNKVVMAENEKQASTDFATAVETKADGARRAAIKEAEGVKQAAILAAQGQAEAIKLVNEAANQYFVGNAQILRKLELTADALKNNSKIVVPANTELVNVMGEMAGVGVTPIPVKK
jgi:regulator of protease activity HflC (stomatin/prohibitin superfamily)